jgi:hypothetical protein
MIEKAKKIFVLYILVLLVKIELLKCSKIKFINPDKIVCKNSTESLNITVLDKILSEEDFIKLTFKYSIHVINQPSEVNHIDYLNKCFQSVIFMYKINQTNIEYIHEKYTLFDYSTNLNNMYAEFTNLKPLKTYDFKIGFNHKNTNLREYLLTGIGIKTCIGRPAKPSNTSTKLYGNGSISIKWQEPQILNSPFVCKYFLVLENNITNQTIKSTYLNQSNYLIDAIYRKTPLRLRLTAINDLECYSELKNECKTQSKSSLEFIDMFESFDLSNRGLIINQNYFYVSFTIVLCIFTNLNKSYFHF